jgi:vacuolar protein sorting-associated protein 29
MVKGRMDVEAASLPLTQVVTHGSVRVGFLEGFTLVSDEPDVLLAEANRLDVDVLCWSGGTHRFECFEYMDKFFVNPGSATGALTADWAAPVGGEGAVGEAVEEVVPSFCLMDVSLPLLFLGDGAGGEVFANRGVCGIGARDFSDVICLPAEERREWC